MTATALLLCTASSLMLLPVTWSRCCQRYPLRSSLAPNHYLSLPSIHYSCSHLSSSGLHAKFLSSDHVQTHSPSLLSVHGPCPVVLFAFERDISCTARSEAMPYPKSTIFLYWFSGLESIKIASENNVRVGIKNLLQKSGWHLEQVHAGFQPKATEITFSSTDDDTTITQTRQAIKA